MRVMFLLMSFVFIAFGYVDTAKADYWGAANLASIQKQVSEELSLSLHGAITGAFKQAVGQIMNTQISMMVGGGGGKGPMFIANWQTFLVSDPRNKTNAYMNDFFSNTTRGRNSLSNYKSAQAIPLPGRVMGSLSPDQQSWLSKEGIVSTAHAASGDTASCPEDNWRCTTDAAQNCSDYGNNWMETKVDSSCGASACSNGKTCVSSASASSNNAYDKNYYKYQTDTAKAGINPSAPDVDLMNYVSGPSEVFNGGNWRGFNSFFSNPANNPFGYSMMAKEAYQGQLAQEQRKADIQAVAYQGFKASVGADGVTVKTPGITIGQIVDKAQSFSMDSISSAQDWGQLISSGISSAATMAISTAVQTGLNSATGALSGATGGAINLNLDAASLAKTDWNGSGSGAASEFDTGMNNFASDATNGVNGGNETWGSMNFAGAGDQAGAAASPKQDSYSPFNDMNYESSNTQILDTTTPTSFIPPNTAWEVGSKSAEEFNPGFFAPPSRDDL